MLRRSTTLLALGAAMSAAFSVPAAEGTLETHGVRSRNRVLQRDESIAIGGAPPRPNIILLMGDDHGWEETGYNGHPHLKTPALDAMAASGLRMDHFYAAHPSCSPTRGSVLTGRHPNRYGTFHPGCSLRPEEVTIAALLRKAGYATGHFGKWHVGPVKATSPTNPGAMGFDEWLSHDNFFELNPLLSRNGGPPERHEGEGSEIIVDEAIRFITKAGKSGKPFFAVVWFGSPHEPYSGLEEDLALYDGLPEEYSRRMVRLTSNETGRRIRRPLRDVLRERYAEITAMDRAIGQLRTHLRDRGLRRNTLLWYCGDNGIPPSGLASSRFRALKGRVYEGGIRVPGIIEWPAGIPEPRTTKVNAVTSDMLPTLCALAGTTPPDRPLDGIDLGPVLDGTMTSRPSPICFWSFRGARRKGRAREPYIDPELQKGTTPLVKLLGGIPTRNFVNHRYTEVREGDFGGPRVILDNRHKLVVDGEKGSGVELFDLQGDPGETDNLLESKPDLAGDLQARLREWQESVLHSLRGEDYGVSAAGDQDPRTNPDGFAWSSPIPDDCPFERSQTLTGIFFTGRHSDYRCGDTFYPSWASDGNLYSPWTDGITDGIRCTSGGSEARGRRTGHAVMIGDDPLKLVIRNTSPPKKAASNPYRGRYPCGSLVHDGIWYYGTYCLGPAANHVHEGFKWNWPNLGPMPGFQISRDLGKTWTPSPLSPEDPLFPEPDKYLGPVKMGAPHFVDFGRNMKHSPDGMAYLLGMGATDQDPKPRPCIEPGPPGKTFQPNPECEADFAHANLSWITADQVYLARVTPSPETINELDAYEFFAGHDSEGQPLWTSDFAEIKPLIEWNNHMGCVTATHVPGLGKYLMCITDGWPTVAKMTSYILEADRITGPWRMVAYMKDFGEQAYFLNFPGKFISTNGRTLWLCYSANFSSGWNGVELSLNPPGGRYGLSLHEVKLLGPGGK